jgi:RNA methyltransferase, TrmH family
MDAIRSAGNERIKRIRALHGRRERERSGLFLVEGLRVVREAVEMGASIETLVVAPELLVGPSGRALVDAHREAGGRAIEVSGEVFRSISLRDGPQGLAAVVRQRWAPLPREAAGDQCWVALHGVQHPGNLGAVLRSCDASGATGVILIGATTDPHDPAAVRLHSPHPCAVLQ